jgi:hypothetical protein
VTITATGGKLSITITKGTPWEIGTVVQEETIETAVTRFGVDNDGTVNADITIHGHDTTAAGGGTPWTLSEDGTAGSNIYGLNFSRQAAPGWTAIPKTTPAVYLSGFTPAAGVDEFGLQILTPTTITDTINLQTAIVTLSAAKA